MHILGMFLNLISLYILPTDILRVGLKALINNDIEGLLSRMRFLIICLAVKVNHNGFFGLLARVTRNKLSLLVQAFHDGKLGLLALMGWLVVTYLLVFQFYCLSLQVSAVLSHLRSLLVL